MKEVDGSEQQMILSCLIERCYGQMRVQCKGIHAASIELKKDDGLFMAEVESKGSRYQQRVRMTRSHDTRDQCNNMRNRVFGLDQGVVERCWWDRLLAPMQFGRCATTRLLALELLVDYRRAEDREQLAKGGGSCSPLESGRYGNKRRSVDSRRESR